MQHSPVGRIWVSFDRGRRWRPLRLNMPPASIADLQIQPTRDDLIAGTHGRGFFILDDLQPLEMYPRSPTAALLFPVRQAYSFWRWWTDGYGTQAGECCAPVDRFTGTNPPAGAEISYYLRAPVGHVSVDVLDGAGRLVRTIDGSTSAGINRVSWDLRETPPVNWGAARPWNQGADGARVVPGTYFIRLQAGALPSQQRPLTVLADPRAPWTQADYQARYDFEEELLDRLSAIDVALNALDARARRRPLTAKERSVYAALTSKPRNSEDDLLRPDRLRERLQSLLLDIGLSAEPPTPAQKAEAASLGATYAQVMARYEALRLR